MKPIPAHILRLMSKKDRKPLGKAGRTPEEIAAAVHHAQERELQSQIGQWLRTQDVEYIKPDMRKRSPLPLGWPDFTLAWRGRAVGIECKVRDEQPDIDQTAQHARMRRSGWTILIARTLSDVVTLFRAIDAEIPNKRTTTEASIQ